MAVEDTALLIVDMQERLLPSIADHESVLRRCNLLVDAANLLHLPVLVTEQYPKGLGHTASDLSSRLSAPIEKLSFSCCGEPKFLSRLHELGKRKILLAGIETHVCVQQTAFDLLAHGYSVFVAADAVGSRREIDKNWALHRMAQCDVRVTTAESAVFEWTKVAGTPLFKQISNLVKQVP